MSMRQALSEETPVKAALKATVQYGLGLFVAGYMAHGYIQNAVAEVKADTARQVAETRSQCAKDLADAISRERERNEFLFRRRITEAP